MGGYAVMTETITQKLIRVRKAIEDLRDVMIEDALHRCNMVAHSAQHMEMLKKEVSNARMPSKDNSKHRDV